MTTTSMIITTSAANDVARVARADAYAIADTAYAKAYADLDG